MSGTFTLILLGPRFLFWLPFAVKVILVGVLETAVYVGVSLSSSLSSSSSSSDKEHVQIMLSILGTETLKPFTHKISLIILLTVCHTILTMLVWRIWYWIN